jgi:ribosomal protein S17E|tara:strand:+ start:307 stop:480 length:174 start_codon:yes stop_codon:yes gene_type:complete
MRNIEKDKSVTTYRLKKVSIKEIVDKYPDKVVDAYTEGKNAVLVLDNMRIKFTNTDK